MRVFLAVELTDEVKDVVARGISLFPRVKILWRWVKRENLHITLRFLGEIDRGHLEGLVRAASAVCSEFPAFDLELSSFGAFPDMRRPRVLFYKAAAGAVELEELAGKLNRVFAAELGIPTDNRTFNPHVTVARVKHSIDRSLSAALKQIPDLENARQIVRAAHLMRSELKRSGAEYNRVKEIVLRRV